MHTNDVKTIDDLLSETGRLLARVEAKQKCNFNISYLQYMSLIDAIPPKY